MSLIIDDIHDDRHDESLLHDDGEEIEEEGMNNSIGEIPVDPKPASVPQHVVRSDEEIDMELGESLNLLLTSFKKEVMKNFFHIKNQYENYRLKSLEELDMQTRKSNYDHSQQVQGLGEKMKVREHYLKKFKILTNNLASHVHKVRTQRKDNNLLRMIMHRWKIYAKRQKRERLLSSVAKFHREQTVKRKVIRGMYRWLHQNRAKTNQLSWEAKLESSVSQVQNDFENEYERIQSEIERTEDRLKRETRNKEVIQERLRKALMKGVCAMNNKFLGIIRDVKPSDTSSSSIAMNQLLSNMLGTNATTMTGKPTESQLFTSKIQQSVLDNVKRNYDKENLHSQPEDEGTPDLNQTENYNHELTKKLKKRYPGAKVLAPTVKVRVFREKKKMSRRGPILQQGATTGRKKGSRGRGRGRGRKSNISVVRNTGTNNQPSFVNPSLRSVQRRMASSRGVMKK